MKNRNFAFLILAVVLTISCNLPAFSAPDVNAPDAASPTPTATAAPTATLSSGPTVPLASPNSGALNCRSGPGTLWPVAMLINPGQTAEIVGRNADGSWWYVKNINLPGSFCWISAEFTTVTGDVSTVAVQASPPLPPTSNVPTAVPAASSGVVTWVDISLSTSTIHVGGCMGPIQPVTVYASITTDGPVKIVWHFEDEQGETMPDHNLNFKKADTQDVSDSFTPPLNAGNWRVVIFIDDMNLKGMNGVVHYTVSC